MSSDDNGGIEQNPVANLAVRDDLEAASSYAEEGEFDETRAKIQEALSRLDEVAGEEANPTDGWVEKAHENVDEWGIQDPFEVLAAISEEVGEINQAYLEAIYEGGNPFDVEREIDDLGPLLIQLVWSLREHPGAFEPLDGGFQHD